jgi:hypothetical protein
VICDAIATGACEKLTKEFTMLASFLTKQVFKYFYVWQLFAAALLIVLLIFWKMYRNKQM